MLIGSTHASDTRLGTEHPLSWSVVARQRTGPEAVPVIKHSASEVTDMHSLVHQEAKGRSCRHVYLALLYTVASPPGSNAALEHGMQQS